MEGYTSTYEIHYEDRCEVYLLSSIREAISQFEATFPSETWTYAKDIIHGTMLTRADYDRIIAFDVEAEPRRKAMMTGLQWPVLKTPDAVPIAIPIEKKEVKPLQGSLF